MNAIALLFLLFQPQDDFPEMIRRLGSVSIVERDEASRRLQDLGQAGVARLEKARTEVRDREVLARLDAVIAAIRASVELEKALGPLRRVTIAARGEPLKELLGRLKAPGVVSVAAGAFDEESRLDFQIRNATWWEALDRVAAAAGARYEIRDSGDGRVAITLVRGGPLKPPVLYVDRFRIMVAEIHHHMSSDNSAAMILVEVRHAADLLPVGKGALKFDSVRDAHGVDASIERPSWAGKSSAVSRPWSTRGDAWVRSDASLPLTVSGMTDIPVARDVRNVSLDLEGEGRRAKVGTLRLSVESLKTSDEGAILTLISEGEEVPDLRDRLVPGSVALIDGEGRRHEGSILVRGASGRWEIEFSSGIRRPQRAVFRWVAEVHRVRIPFRLEEVRLPKAS